ncbi:MAG: glycosyltransferase family 1 protein, partial [Patescibacteria group bacterium]|nr:glycosyltransferase family 1 protein [Patescibacteria group bacterium]
ILYLEQIDHINKYVIFLRRENFDLYLPANKNFTKVLADYKWYSFGEQLFFPFTLYKHKCDIIHFPHFNVPLLYFKKFIVTIHDLILLRYSTQKASTHNIFFYWVKFILYRIVIFNAVHRALSIIAVSQFTKTDICKQYGRVCYKITVIHESAEIYQKGMGGHAQNLLKYGIIKPYMLYVGNAYPHKNLYALVDAFFIYRKNSNKDFQLILVGCDDYFYKELQQYIKTKNISHIIILYTVTDELLQQLYKEATFFVFSSLYEGFGLPPLEAQLLGTPVLSSDHPCMIEILSHSGALYCDTTNVEVFAQMMQKIVSNDDLRLQLVQKGRENVKKYSWQKMAKKTHNIYTKNT